MGGAVREEDLNENRLITKQYLDMARLGVSRVLQGILYGN